MVPFTSPSPVANSKSGKQQLKFSKTGSRPSPELALKRWSLSGKYYALTKKRFSNARDAQLACREGGGFLIRFRSGSELTRAHRALEEEIPVDSDGT